MKHDLAHEEKQNEAIRLLAKAIEDVADQCGWLGAKGLAEQAEAILATDEQESDAPAVPADVPVVAPVETPAEAPAPTDAPVASDAPGDPPVDPSSSEPAVPVTE